MQAEHARASAAASGKPADDFESANLASVQLRAFDDYSEPGVAAGVQAQGTPLAPGAVIGAVSMWTGVATDFVTVSASPCQLLVLSAADLATVLSLLSTDEALAVGRLAVTFLKES